MIRNFFKRRKKIARAAEPIENQAAKDASFKPVNPLPTPEELCNIDPESMSVDEILEKLKQLYKRHNEAAASLNEELRNEAEMMLDAIVECHEKYVNKA